MAEREVSARSALKLALEALESYEKSAYIKQSHPKRWANGKKAITAIKEALAQPAVPQGHKQEPVGQLLEEAYGRGQVMWFNKPDDFSMLYTIPPQRTAAVGEDSKTWVGLTDEEMDGIWADQKRTGESITRAIEAKLKEKNT